LKKEFDNHNPDEEAAKDQTVSGAGAIDYIDQHGHPK